MNKPTKDEIKTWEAFADHFAKHSTSGTATDKKRWKFCPECGEKLGDEWKFCSKCGTKVGSWSIAQPVHPWMTPLPYYEPRCIYPLKTRHTVQPYPICGDDIKASGTC